MNEHARWFWRMDELDREDAVDHYRNRAAWRRLQRLVGPLAWAAFGFEASMWFANLQETEP